MKLNLEDFKKVLDYNPETGWFTWKIKVMCYGGGKNPGDRAGTEGEGRRQIKVLGRMYREHRLAWYFMTGEFPPKGMEIDHKDLDATNNRWNNLRLATKIQNSQNKKPESRCKSGIRGVSLRSDTGKYHARISANKKIILLGNYDTVEEAAKVRRDAELKYFGQFAPQNGD